MKTVYWIGGVVVASVIGYVVWKLISKGEAKFGLPSFDEGQPMGGAAPANVPIKFTTPKSPPIAKVLKPTFNKPVASANIGLPAGKKIQMSTGLGFKKGFR